MCTSAIRWAGFKEYICATSIDHLVQLGWGQILIANHEVIERSWLISNGIKFLGSIGTEFTDPFFEWQFQNGGACPKGCTRGEEGDGLAFVEASSTSMIFGLHYYSE